MPAKLGRNEQTFIKLFVSAYENFAWANSEINPLDEYIDGAPEALITRPDGQTMAIEHTLIEPFVGEKSDCAMFEKPFLKIENDKSLAVPNTGIIVYVPAGVLDRRSKADRNLIVESIHSWIEYNRLCLREGTHRYSCDIPGMPSVTLTVKQRKFGLPLPNGGSLLVRRQQVKNDLHEVVEKALRRKLPKLINTNADRHVLFLERDQFSFEPDLIFTEIERQRPSFPLLNRVDEIWHVETTFYEQGGLIDFELRKNGKILASMAFENDILTWHSNDGLPYSI